ncbi:acyl-CoA dehydrogenase family protein [Paenibacillus senegalensis]|uniref:acyl-CoA dehydrogenase family protein n=1 Tax=Paenibacillus senegalensis TaxID=1465766 RepID=UPI0002894FFE|nr:acyl-CoA dehydrogenase family protein [Paenibacillus senegalensis]
MSQTDRERLIAQVIEQHLKPHVRQIDEEGAYPVEYLRELGRQGLYYPSSEEGDGALIRDNVDLIRATSRRCLTTGFNVWCHLAAVTYVCISGNEALRRQVLPGLLNGDLIGGTGLSNPMKYYAGLDRLYLRATRLESGGFEINGTLPMVSNLGPDHWFAAIAAAGEERVAFFVPCSLEGMKMTERTGYLGLNGSATYSCAFDRTNVPEEWVLAHDADQWVCDVRGIFILYQIPIGLGLVEAAVQSMRKSSNLQQGCNRYLKVQPEQLEEQVNSLIDETHQLALRGNVAEYWESVLQLRLRTAYLVLQAAQYGMLHQGSAGYTQYSSASRRLREAYFFANLTPSVRHLEKLTQLAAAR